MSTNHALSGTSPGTSSTPDFLKYLPGWIGFLALIIVGAIMVIIGIAVTSPANQVGFIVFGACAFIVGAFSWIAGGTSQIVGTEGRVGVRVQISDLPWWAFLVDFLVIAASIVIFYVFK
ncbi:MAG: hypothetical protein JW795_18130 [Chitinivibrionales bacterium]|nr:hypothetical protein [Chitinivibrionales bacterium]